MAAVHRHYPQHLERSLLKLVGGRLRVLHLSLLALIQAGENPARAVQLVADQARVFDEDREAYTRIGLLADGWVTKQVAVALRPRLSQADVAATLHAGPNAPRYVADPDSEIVVRRDADDDRVTINGTEFRPPAGHVVVLASRDKLEAAYAHAEGHLRPGRHNANALRYGDYVDLNRPVSMLTMASSADFRQGYKVRALSDRGFGVVPVAVPEEQAEATRKRLGAPRDTQRAVRERAGERMIDPRSWSEGIIGRGRSIERDYLKSVDEAVTTAQREGQSVGYLTKVLRKQFKRSEARARFIARDRMGSLNAAITKAKHERLGFQFYRWLTSDDARVRPEHAALHNTIRPWSSPHPTEGHPGEAPNCRCVPVPATLDEYNRERRTGRGVAIAALGVGAAVVAGLAARRVFRAPHIPVTKPVPKPKPAEVIPIGPRVPQREAARAGTKVAQVVRLPAGGRAVMRRSASARFRFAHQLTRRIREAELQRGVPRSQISNYAATFGAADRAIRDAATDGQLMERLARLAGDRGQIATLPRRVRVRGKLSRARRTSRRRRRR